MTQSATAAVDVPAADHKPIRPITAWVPASLRSVRVVVGLAIVVLFVVVAIFAPLVATHDPNIQNLPIRNQGPSSPHLLGTDDFGRDAFSRLVYGARVSLLAALIAVSVAVVGGLSLGLVAGYARGIAERLFTWLCNVVMSVPALILAITMVAIFGRGLVTSMISVGIAMMPVFYRVTRAQTRVVAAETYIEASDAVGCHPARVLLVHVLPNVLSPVLVQGSMALGWAITAEASLSFLGFGIRPPTASWGSMLQEASQYLETDPSQVIVPGLAITVVVLGFGLLGDAFGTDGRRRRRRSVRRPTAVTGGSNAQ